ncbi:MAG TPA: alpha/beta hydrolase [Bryobacteraceae bacterium]|nr:alpha/beta hydrolase [Bryobacteraceae bacterium]
MSALSLVSLLAFSVAAQSQPAPPPLGQLVDVGGYRVHIYCTGQGSPVVVIVGAGFSFDWSLVQSGVAPRTKICTYDVSGTAWSDPGPSLTCQVRVNEVHKVLTNAKIDGPYVLVGLSVGGMVGRLYASLYPSEVAGMVIVDHAFIDVGGDAPSVTSSPAFAGLDSPPVLIHQTPIVLTVEDTSNFRKLPESIQELHRWADSLKPALPTVETAQDCLVQLKGTSQAANPLGNRPLVVVSTGNDLPNYKKLQTELLALSGRSRQLMANSSFHSVEIDQPEVVVEAIRQVVNMVREIRQ